MESGGGERTAARRVGGDRGACRAALAARAEALLDEFEEDIENAFLSQDMSAVKVICELYERRFRALAQKN